ncbi:MAG: response regulator transcription factor [Chitinophagia bacterium]|jgi:DNA-binding NarL/FixJ family response regulator
MFNAASTINLIKKNVPVAVVDDHHLVRTGLIRMIQTFTGFEVVLEAANGKEFQEKLNRLSSPEIVLLDIRMPIMDGYETALWLHTHLPETRVLVVSMVKEEVAVIRMLRLGAYGFLPKDATIEQLHQALICISEKNFYVNELAGSRMFHYISAHAENNHSVTFPEITHREFIFLRYCSSELTYGEIAKRMHVSPRTIDTYRDHLFEKCKVKSRVGLVIFAIKYRLIDMGDKLEGWMGYD